MASTIGALVASCGGARPHILFGFNQDPPGTGLRLQAELNMPVRRFKVSWSQVEPAPGTWDWSAPDAGYRAMRAAGLRPLLLAVDAPCWAGGQGAFPCYGPPAPAFDRGWGQYIRRLVARYRDAVGLEIFNEPNSARMFLPAPNVARYVTLLRVAYRAAKQADPSMPVISGGLLPAVQSTSRAIGDARFLREMFRDGAGRAMDGIGAHPYPVAVSPGELTNRYDVSAMEADLNRLRAVRNAAGENRLSLWITEAGVSTQAGPGFPPGATPTQQAHDLLAMIDAVRQDGDVRLFLIHRLVDAPPALKGTLADLEAGFGVFQADGSPKPAACALSKEFGGSLRC